MKHQLYFLKSFFKRIFTYPSIKERTVDYDKYWVDKKKGLLGQPNSFQLYRALWISKRVKENSSVLDMACGDGSVLLSIMEKKKIESFGTDIS